MVVVKVKVVIENEAKLRALRRKGYISYRHYKTDYFLNVARGLYYRPDFDNCRDCPDLLYFTGIWLEDECIGNIAIHGDHVHVFKKTITGTTILIDHIEAREIISKFIAMLEKHGLKVRVEGL